MDLDGLTTSYTLVPRKLSPLGLLLDPTNPRLITESAQDRSYTTDEIKSAATQDYIRELVWRKEHDVKRLIASIKEMGFVGGLHEMIVKDLGHGGPYLVIEGNRRTAALQYLLGSHEALRPDVLESIQRIEVKEFVYRSNSHQDEATVIDVLLGSIHIDGSREWGALERAHYVHRSYMRVYGEARVFRYDVAAARAAGLPFKMTPHAVNKCLTICRVYEQLRRADVGVEPKHFTLIDLAIKTRAVAGPYFELDRDACELSDVGLERFTELVLGENPAIHNPRLFNLFVEVYTDGTEFEVEQVVAGEKSLEDACEAIRRRKDRRGFRDNLEAVRDYIGALYLEDFRGTEGERQLILKIKRLVDQRLLPLTRSMTKTG